MWDRNPNTGHRFAQDSVLKIADQTIFHDADHQSEVTLPIVSESLAGEPANDDHDANR